MAVILAQKHGNQAWILQCMTAVQEAVQNSIEMLSGAPPQTNAMAIGRGGQYQFPARTAAELQATQNQAAVNGETSAPSMQQAQIMQKADAAMAAGNVDMFALLQQQAGIVDPASQGMPVQNQEAPAGDNEWLL